jgi:hypothetical protein
MTAPRMSSAMIQPTLQISTVTQNKSNHLNTENQGENYSNPLSKQEVHGPNRSSESTWPYLKIFPTKMNFIPLCGHNIPLR